MRLRTAMDVTLPADLREQAEQELASGQDRGPDGLVEQAVRQFFGGRERAQRKLEALRRIGHAIDQAGLYEQVLIPAQE
jgi:predicted transcriptional regulator